MSEALPRPAQPAEVERLARIWFDGWQDAHAGILPEELRRARTLESFRGRLAEALERVRVVGPAGEPIGFCLIQHDELYQLFVTAEARGTGAARALVDDAEARFARAGVEVAWLACAIGNHRAARFYQKCGWSLAGTVTLQLETGAGTLPLEVWRYEKRVGA